MPRLGGLAFRNPPEADDHSQAEQVELSSIQEDDAQREPAQKGRPDETARYVI